MRERKREVARVTEPRGIRLEERGRPACGPLVETQVATARRRVVREGLIEGRGGEGIGEDDGVEEREVDALTELGTERVTGVAENGDAFAVPAGEAHVVIDGDRELGVIDDLREQIAGLWSVAQDLLFPRIERRSTPAVHLVETDAPEETEKVVRRSGGQKADELASGADALPERVAGEEGGAATDEP